MNARTSHSISNAPAEIYQPSARCINEDDNPIVYDAGMDVKHVSDSGHVAHEGKNYHVGEAFAGKPVAVRLNDRDKPNLDNQ